jgi:hypothetical protein
MATLNTGATGTATQDPSILSNINSGLQSAGDWLGTPGGQLVTAAGVGTLGYLQGASAQSQAKQLAGQITAPVAPLQALGTGTVNQVMGGPAMPGQYGTTIGNEMTAATGLSGVAAQYGSGQLTPAQQQEIQQAVGEQTSQANLAFGMASSPGEMSSAALAERQQIQNNALMMGDQLQRANIQTAQAALQSVQEAYQNILSPALQSASLAVGANATAVGLQIQQNAAIASSLNKLWSSLATGVTTAAGGGNQSTNMGTLMSKLFGSGANTGSTDTSTPASAPANYAWGAGPGGSDWAAGVSSPDVTPTYDPSMASNIPSWFDSSGGTGDGVSLGS